MLFANPGVRPRSTLEQAPTAVWLDLINPTDDERAAAAAATGLTLPSRAEISEVEMSSRASTQDRVLFLNSPVSYRDAEGRSAIASVGFVLSEHRLVTLRFAEMPAFDRFAERFAGQACAGGAEAFAGLIEAVVDRMADVMERVGAELDQLSRGVFSGADARRQRGGRSDLLRAALVGVGRCGDTIGNLRDTVLGLGRIVGYAQLSRLAWIDETVHARLATAREDIASLSDYDEQLTSKSGFLLDAVLGFISIEQNDGVRVLTIVSVVGIPPTFVVGLYGMNFKSIQEYDWVYGYQYGLAVIALSIIVPLVWFRVKGWL